MTPTIHLIHGIRDDGTNTTEVLARLLSVEGFNVKPHRVERTHTWHAANRRDTRLLAKTLIHHIQPGDSIICHSHGCGIGMAILNELSVDYVGNYLSRIVMLAPALARKQHFEELHFDSLLCMHNPVDFAIWAGSALPFHPFGMAGAFGFNTKDPRVRNEARLSFVGPFNHTSPYFQEPYVEDVVNRVDDFLTGDKHA